MTLGEWASSGELILSGFDRVLGRAVPAILSEHVVQPDAEPLDLRAEPAESDLGLVEFVGRLFAGREQERQRLEESAVGRCHVALSVRVDGRCSTAG